MTSREDGKIHDRGLFKSLFYSKSQNCYKATQEFLLALRNGGYEDIFTSAQNELGVKDVMDCQKPLRMCNVKSIMSKVDERNEYIQTQILQRGVINDSESLYNRAKEDGVNIDSILNKLVGKMQDENLNNSLDVINVRDKIFNHILVILENHDAMPKSGVKALSMLLENFEAITNGNDADAVNSANESLNLSSVEFLENAEREANIEGFVKNGGGALSSSGAAQLSQTLNSLKTPDDYAVLDSTHMKNIKALEKEFRATQGIVGYEADRPDTAAKIVDELNGMLKIVGDMNRKLNKAAQKA